MILNNRGFPSKPECERKIGTRATNAPPRSSNRIRQNKAQGGTLGAALRKGKDHHCAYFAKRHALAECCYLRIGMLRYEFRDKEKARVKTRAENFSFSDARFQHQTL